MKITGIKKAVGEYQRANAGGFYSPEYGVIMLDRTTGEVWSDRFYDLGRNSWIDYSDSAIINLVGYGFDLVYGYAAEMPVNMKTVREAAEKLCERWKAEHEAAKA